MSARLSAVEALLLTPFVGGVLFIVFCAVSWVARYERRRNPYLAAVERGRKRGRA